MNCPHYHLTKVSGPLHPDGKDYQCIVCKVILKVDMKPVEIIPKKGKE